MPPDLHVLPPLLHAGGAFGALRARLGAENAPLPAGGRHAALAAGATEFKQFLLKLSMDDTFTVAETEMVWEVNDVVWVMVG